MVRALARALGLVTILLAVGCVSLKDDGHPDARLPGEESGVDGSESGVDGSRDAGADTTIVTEAAAPAPMPCASPGAWSCPGVGTPDLLVCNDGGLWQNAGRCPGDQLCDATDGGSPGTCRDPIAACSADGPGTLFCNDESILQCNADLLTTTSVQECAGAAPACEKGACAECHPGTSRCFEDAAHSVNTLQQCSASMTWVPVGCDAGAICNGVGCGGQSCDGIASVCGRDGDESCCTQLLVPGGQFKRDDDNGVTTTGGGGSATVSDFLLDKFEVSVIRFRKFVDAYPGSRPQAGDGAHPAVPGSGWQSAWDSLLPPDGPSLVNELYCSPIYATNHSQYWAPNINPLPITCVSWQVAFAFCAWDGGRLPTEAEWNYAASGGAEQRVYPWSTPPTSMDINANEAAYWTCPTCPLGNPVPVGSRWMGAGRWGHLDLAGNAWEWVRDEYSSTYVVPCDDCIQLVGDGSGQHIVRGGSFGDTPALVVSSSRLPLSDMALMNVSFRCARDVLTRAGLDAGDGG
jgi:formylglycine-generating enzyme required for sulfatase activity